MTLKIDFENQVLVIFVNLRSIERKFDCSNSWAKISVWWAVQLCASKVRSCYNSVSALQLPLTVHFWVFASFTKFQAREDCCRVWEPTLHRFLEKSGKCQLRTVLYANLKKKLVSIVFCVQFNAISL